MHGPFVSRRFARPLVVMAVLALVAALVPIIPAVAAPVKAQPATILDEIWVDGSVAGPGTGTETDPFRLLSDGLAVAGDGSMVYVAPGGYGAGDGETLPFVVPSGVTIIGTYDADEGWVTSLYGEWEGTSPIMVVTGADYVRLENIAFVENMNIGAFGAQVLPMYAGAGLFVAESYVEVSNCSFSDLIASGGSAIYAQDSDVLVEGSVFAYNGNAIMGTAKAVADEYKDDLEKFNLDSVPRAQSSVWAQQPPLGCQYGGAILAFDSGLDVYNSLFAENSAANSGGAMLTAYGWTTTTGCVFFYNAAENMMNSADAQVSASAAYSAQVGAPFGGGAVSSYMDDYDSANDLFIFNYGDPGAAVVSNTGEAAVSRAGIYGSYGAAVVAFDYSVESDSVASFGSEIAGLVIEPPTDPAVGLDIDACTFFENYGIFTTYSSVKPTRISNSLYAGNEALDIVYMSPGILAGGVMPPEDTYPETSVEGCTFADNWADYAIVEGDLFDYTALVNTIIYDTGATEESISVATWDATNVDAWNNDIEGGLDAGLDVDNISEDPMFRDPQAWDYSLLAASPCIDTGADAGPAESGILFDPRPWDLDYMFRPNDGDDDGEALYDMGAFEFLPSGRIDGANRYTTAVETSQQFFGEADTIVLATGRAFADGLAGSGLAGLYDAPLLLTNGVTLMPEVAAEIERLGASRAFILGGEEAISADVEEALWDMGLEVVRIGGVDRYETAALIAEHLFYSGMLMSDGSAFIARGDLFPDALAAAPIAYANHMPVLLVRPDALPEHTVDVWHQFGITNAIVIGGDVAVNESVVQALAPSEYERISGANRYETAANLAEWAWDDGYADFGVTGVATGEDFADALSGGAGIGSQYGVLLLTPYASVAPACEGAISNHASEVVTMQTFGGLNAVSDTVYDYLMELLD